MEDENDEQRARGSDPAAAARWAEGAAKLLRDCCGTVAGLLRDCGLNNAGCWSAPEMGEQEIAYCCQRRLSEARKVGWPDVFDPKWVEQVNRRVMDQCGKLKSEKWLVGYLNYNELRWEHEGEAKELLKQFLAMPAVSPSRLGAEGFAKKSDTTAADFIAAFRDHLAGKGGRPC